MCLKTLRTALVHVYEKILVECNNVFCYLFLAHGLEYFSVDQQHCQVFYTSRVTNIPLKKGPGSAITKKTSSLSWAPVNWASKV